MPSTFYSHHGSSVGSQHTKHTLHVKHMARSSPDEAGCKKKRQNAKFKVAISIFTWALKNLVDQNPKKRRALYVLKGTLDLFYKHINSK